MVRMTGFEIIVFLLYFFSVFCYFRQKMLYFDNFYFDLFFSCTRFRT